MILKMRILILLTLSLLMASCIQIEEIVYLKNDGSLKWTLNFKIPDMSKQDAKKNNLTVKKKNFVDQSLLKAMGVEYHENRSVRSGVEKVGISMDLKNPEMLKSIYQNIKPDTSDTKPDDKKTVDSLDGIFSLKNAYQFKQQGSTYTISRKITLPKPKKPAVKDKQKKDAMGFGSEFGDMFLNMMYIRFEIVTDGKIVSSNADEQVANSLRWEASLGGLMHEALQIEAKIQLNP